MCMEVLMSGKLSKTGTRKDCINTNEIAPTQGASWSDPASPGPSSYAHTHFS